MPKEATEKKPSGWEKLSREGSPEGGETGYCSERKQFYNVTSGGLICWHTMPEGFHYDPEQDAVVPVKATKNEAAPVAGEEKP